MDRKSILAFVIIFLIILAMPSYFKLFNKTPDTLPEQEIQIEPQKEPVSTISTDRLAIPKTQHKNISEASKAEHITVETDLYTAQLSSIGGGTLTSFVLKQYNIFKENDTTLVELITDHHTPPLIIKYISIDGDSIILKQNFIVDNVLAKNTDGNTIWLSGADSATITFTLIDKNQITVVQKALVFYGDNYIINIETDLRNLQRDMATKHYDLSWDGGLAYTEPNIVDETRYSKAYAYSGGETEALDVKINKSA
ncbi:MAG: membrane protein insertase YidC, partial [Candidatus Marinimicrobia bacterium]|nr:membrane protein insertase YidC [Candidatus Neomarinimicrobiota bacterium]